MEGLGLKKPHILNEDPISFDNEKLIFEQDQYGDGSTRIICKTISGDYYSDISIDVLDHVRNHNLEFNEIILNHNLDNDLKDLFYDNFCCNEEYSYVDCPEVNYGFSYSNIIKIYPSLLIKTY